MISFFGKYGTRGITSTKANIDQQGIFQPDVIIAVIQAKLAMYYYVSKQAVIAPELKTENVEQWSGRANKLVEIQNNKSIRIETRCYAMLTRAKVLYHIYLVRDYACHNMQNYNQSLALCMQLPSVLFKVGSCSWDGINILTEAFEFLEQIDSSVSKTFRDSCNDLWPKQVKEEKEAVLSSAHWNLMM